MHDLIKLSVVVFFFLSIVILLYLICVECNISFIASHIKLHFNSIMSVKKISIKFHQYMHSVDLSFFDRKIRALMRSSHKLLLLTESKL